MKGFWISMFVFAAVLCGGMGVYYLLSYSRIGDMMNASREKPPIQFFDSLWDYHKSGLTQEAIVQYAALFTAIGAGIGFVLFGKMLGLILAIFGFITGPRILSQYIANKFKKDFNRQYPQAVSRLSVAASLMPIKNTFGDVAERLHNPSKKVFGYIARQIENNVPPDKAVAEAAKVFQLSELEPLAELVELLNEVGGGDSTTASFATLVENVRTVQRHEAKVSSHTGELKSDVLISALFVVLITGFTYSDGGGEMSQLYMQYNWLIWAGTALLFTGVFITYRVIARATRFL